MRCIFGSVPGKFRRGRAFVHFRFVNFFLLFNGVRHPERRVDADRSGQNIPPGDWPKKGEIIMKRFPKHALAVFASIAITGLATASSAEESAQAGAGILKMNVVANCQDGKATFKIRNLGDDWPKTSTFAIYNMRKKGKKRVRRLITKRRMRLKDGQRASFKVKTENLPTGRLGLWVKPDWYKRDFDYDAVVNCG
ncbi:MAG: hypothetical protein HN719_06835 [Alphaproteobacteria bacterium]|nr:hypothetical protein [Alphaproteobacteria bacterium]